MKFLVLHFKPSVGERKKKKKILKFKFKKTAHLHERERERERKKKGAGQLQETGPLFSDEKMKTCFKK